MFSERVLKHDSFGVIKLRNDSGRPSVLRDACAAKPGLRWLAARLAKREADALRIIGQRDGFPRLLSFDGWRVQRSYLPGTPLYGAETPPSPHYFRAARRVLSQLHRLGIAHNDLAKEANWIVTHDGRPGIIDFQLAVTFRRRSKLFRVLAREDYRHLLKHKRHYCSHALTARECAMLARPSLMSRLWRLLVKPPYRFVTRYILRWPARRGPIERGMPD
jgi:RIO-like serine/threonine protein kinase